MTVRDLLALEHAAEGDQMVASKFLEAVDRIPPPMIRDERPRYLSVAADSESMYLNGTNSTFNDRFFVFGSTRMQFFRRGDLGTMDLMASPRGISFHQRFGYLTITPSSGDPNQFARRITIHTMTAGTVVVGLWMFWLMARGMCAVMHRAMVRRRRRNGRCAGCGYILA